MTDHDEMCLFARQSEAMGVQSPRSADECLLCRQCRIARRGVLDDLRAKVEGLPSAWDPYQLAGWPDIVLRSDVLALLDGGGDD